MTRARSSAAFLFFALLVVVCFVPFRRMTAPLWYIRVTHQDGTPASNVLVREEANDYSCGSAKQEDATSDKDGQVEFPSKSIRTTIAQCIFQTIKSGSAGVHASFGLYTYAFAIGVAGGDIIDARGNIYAWTGQPAILHSQMTIRP